MFTQILVLLDGSKRAEQAIAVAKRLSETTHAPLNLLSVIDEDLTQLRQSASLACNSLVEAVQQEEAYREDYLAHIVQYYHLPLPQTTYRARRGPLLPTILATIQEYHIDLVILCSHSDIAESSQQLGSVAKQLIAQSAVPLLILKDGGSAPHSGYPDMRRPLHSVEIVVALDGTDLAEQAIPLAAHLISAIASPARGTVHLVHIHCLPPSQVQLPREHLRRTEEYQQALHYVRQQARKLQEQEGQHLNIATLYSIFPALDIQSGLLHFAEKRYGKVIGASDLLAMYTHLRPQRAHTIHTCITTDVLTTIQLPLFVV
jgi:nucleotide-binding universal stress UspA family protein